ncbi:guanine nucleotide-binding subunit alpha-12 isoform X2 [Labeo rohita]|uniref:Guanine nucleotide-binding subunit alpha-12 isoform X2 n=1 Tax=Labeo rohita TaxID=84645 RepID=A0A498LU88_LABRO|nr:guanine nucleotide-binding subunit alpha-12 isoform X2 [Labeo rohita]
MVDEHQRGTVSESVRPKRQTRHPAYFDDFEVDYGGYRPRGEHPPPLSTARYEHRQEQESSDSRGGARQMAHRTPPRDSNPSSESTSYPCLPVPRAQSFGASQYRTATRKLPESSTPFHEQTANIMPAPHSGLKGQISSSAPPTLYGRSASLDSHASPSYVVSPDPYSPPARTHYSVSAVSHGANDPSYPPLQQRASPTEPYSMMVLIDKMMGQLQLMRDDVASRHGTPSRSLPRPPQSYKEPPPAHYEYPNQQWYVHAPQYADDRAYGPSDRFQSSYEPAARSKIDMYHHSMSLPAQKPKPSFSEQPSLQLKESAAEYRGPKPSIPYLVHKDPSEFARLKLALHNLLPEDASELFKFQILVDHLQLEEAKLIADSFLNSPYPYTATMAALTEKFGKPHQLALSKIARVMDAPDVRPGDPEAFERFAL